MIKKKNRDPLTREMNRGFRDVFGPRSRGIDLLIKEIEDNREAVERRERVFDAVTGGDR